MKQATKSAVSDSKTEAAAIVTLAQAAEDAARPIISDTTNGRPRLFIPDGYTVQDLEKDLPQPLQLKGTVNLQSTDSFIAYVKQYKGTREVAVYKDATSNTVTAVFDHHSADKTGWGAHRAVITMKQDPRFVAWLELNNKPISQSGFADFLEDHLGEIKDPNASQLLSIITDLKVGKTINTQHTKNLRNGNISLVWDENTTESMEVPSRFTIQVPVYATSAKAYEFTARLRYRFQDRQLVWIFIIDKLIEVKRQSWLGETSLLDALDGVCPIFDGTPPAAAA